MSTMPPWRRRWSAGPQFRARDDSGEPGANQKGCLWGPVKDARAPRKAWTRKLNTLPKKWWNVTGWKTALSGCFEQRRLYLIGHIDGHEPVGRV